MQVALHDGLCYSWKVELSSGIFPWPCGLPWKGIWEAGSLGQARVIDPVAPVGNPTENKPLHDPGSLLPTSPVGLGALFAPGGCLKDCAARS